MLRLRSLALAATLLFATLGIDAAVVSGSVKFQTRRSQKVNPEETLVALEPVSGRTPRIVPGHFEVTTRAKTLLPHVIAVPVGSTVAFPNEDPISHNIFSLSRGNAFDLGLYRRGAGKSQKFETPGVVNIYCNVHPNMSAVVHVMATPYYTFADADGRYSVDVPPGRYRLSIWNEQGGASDRLIDVGTDGRVRGSADVEIDARNNRRTQHKNKSGRGYAIPKDY